MNTSSKDGRLTKLVDEDTASSEPRSPKFGNLEIRGSSHATVPILHNHGNTDHLVKVLKGALILNEGITAFNFYCSWLQLVIISLIMFSVDTLQALYMKNLGVDSSVVGMVVAEIQLIDYSMKILACVVYGPLIDNFGRRKLYFWSIINIAIGYFIIPFQTQVFPGYIIGKLLISHGAVCIQLLPLLGDYVHDSKKGTASGLNYTLGAAGAVLSAAILYLFALCDFSLEANYATVGAIILILGGGIGFGVKGGTDYYRKQAEAKGIATAWNSLSLRQQASRVCSSFASIPWLPISMICGILGASDLFVLTSGLVLFVEGKMPPGGNSKAQVGLAQLIFGGGSVAVSFMYGRMMDKVDHIKLLLPLLTMATVGFYIIPFLENIQGPWFYIWITIEGFALPGVFLFATFLGVTYCPPDQRGSLGGLITGVAFLAAMVVMVTSGVLYDNGTKGASLVIFCGMINCAVVGIALIWFFKIRGRKFD
jgi:MFS family permease